MKTATTIALMIVSFTFTLAQTGTIRGTVFDDANGEMLVGVTVLIDSTTNGAVTDLDGNFEIKATPGVYTLKISYISYAPLAIANTEVVEGEVTVLDNIRLTERVSQLSEVVVTADAIRSSEEGLLIVKKKSINLMDGISAANFRKIGDSDAASAVKRVPGVSVEGGKYVYVRGLGDRYTKSTLNGVDIPGLDPDRNTVQMDMFPTSLIDNIVVIKSFTPDLPGDFTGGIVNIDSKDFAEERVLNVSGSLGYNPAMHLNNEYLNYQGGKTDFLGFDDGTRSIPTARREDIPQYADVVGNVDSHEGRQFRNILEGFNPNLAALRTRSNMDYGIGLNFGDQITRGRNTVGYNFSLGYSNNTEYYEDAIYGRFGKSNPEIFELNVREFQRGDFGVNNVSLNGMAGFAIKRELAKYKLNIIRTHSGASTAGIFNYENSDLGANFQAVQHNLEYSQRSLTNVLLNGIHNIRSGGWKIEWKLSPTRSTIQDPDIRYTRYRLDGGNYTIGTESGYPERIWRFLEEDNLVARLDLDKQYQLFGSESKLKFGALFGFRERNYEIQNFQIIPQGVAMTGDPNELFQPDNLWPTNASGSRGTRYESLFMPNNPNKFNAEASTAAFYVLNEFNMQERLKAIVGVRVETYSQFYSGNNQQGLVLNDAEVLDDIDFFPSANLIYAITDDQNLRFSYSKTIARPSFKEASFAEILDPITGRIYIGGFFQDKNSAGEVIWDGNLTATRINNFDARWELFQKRGQTLALGGFYKTFDRPIEIVQYVQAPNNFQPRNVGDGSVLGIELEARHNLGFIARGLENFGLNGNITLIDSRIRMSATEYESRKLNAREGEVVNRSRQMAGQAPFIFNVGAMYAGQENGLEAGLYYNVQGETLIFVGVADKPDVYSVPFHSLNFNLSQKFGVNDKMQLGVNITNMLGADRQQVFRSFYASDQTFSSTSPGTSFNLKFGYNF